MANYRLAAGLILLFAIPAFAGPAKKDPKGQKVPSPQRVVEIHDALVANGFPTGTSWPEIQATCRKIQEDHLWQTDHAPDARVLILIGLGGPHSNPGVIEEKSTNRLDEAQRIESARRKANHEPAL
jgi:hypothetical protein